MGIAIADQATKLTALWILGLDGREVTVIPGFLWFYVIKNTGAAFGLFQSLGPFLALVSLVLIYAAYKMIRHEEDTLLLISLSLILGGASGNLIDRIFRGGVIDFIRVPNWPIFNIADSAISVGTVLIIYFAFIRSRREGFN